MKAIFPIAILACALAAQGCSPEENTNRHQTIDGTIFATHYRVTFQSNTAAATVKAAVEAELQRIDNIASNWIADSEIQRYHQAADKASFELSDDLARLLELSDEMKQFTNGAFDIRFKPTEINLSAIAKGYAVDRVSQLLKSEFGIQSHLVEIGGEIKACGTNPNGQHWTVGIYNPSSKKPARTIELINSSIATSGGYLKGDHITNPITHTAPASNLISVSVIHPSNAIADAIATALYVMGPAEGLDWAKDHNIRVIFMLKDGAIIEHRSK